MTGVEEDVSAKREQGAATASGAAVIATSNDLGDTAAVDQPVVNTTNGVTPRQPRILQQAKIPIQKVTQVGKVMGQKITHTVTKIKNLHPNNSAQTELPAKTLAVDTPPTTAIVSDDSNGLEHELGATGEQHAHVILPHFRNSPKATTTTSEASTRTTAETPVHSNNSNIQTRQTSTTTNGTVYQVQERRAQSSSSWIQHLWWISIAMVLHPTYQYWRQEQANDTDDTNSSQNISSMLLVGWLWVAFLTGQVIRLENISDFVLQHFRKKHPTNPISSSTQQSQSKSTTKMDETNNEQTHCTDHEEDKTTPRKHHKPMAPLWSSLNPNNRNHTGRGVAPPKWLRRLDPKDFGRLIRKHKHARQNTDQDGNNPEMILSPCIEESPSFETQATTDTSMGVVKNPDKNVRSFDDMAKEWVTHPILGVRGMDIFLSEDPPEDVGNNAWLVQQGLRTVPTLLLNGMTQWGNVLVYFQLPEWVTDFDEALQIHPDDPDTVRALKDFLAKNDDYRNERFKFIPAVVEGPMAVKILAPPKKERVIHGQVISLDWKKYDKEVDPVSGQPLQPLISVTVDCVSNSAIRKMANIVKKYLASLTLDLALVISAPPNCVNSDADEHKACLGLFRFEKVDVSSCPNFPTDESDQSKGDEKWSSEMEADLLRASVLCGMSSCELKDFCDEHKATTTADVTMSELTV